MVLIPIHTVKHIEIERNFISKEAAEHVYLIL